jgi:hypothetical protein
VRSASSASDGPIDSATRQLTLLERRAGDLRTEKCLAIGLQVMCAISLLPLLYTSLYTHPAGADDYKYSQWEGFQQTWLGHYSKGGGRYFGALMVMLSPVHWHSVLGYRIACITLLVLFGWSFYRLISTAICTYTSAPKYMAGAIGAAGVVLMVNNMDALSESFFWYSGAMTHMLPAILFTWLLMLFIRLKPEPGKLQQIAGIALCIAIMGGGELTMMLCLLTCLGYWLYYRRNEVSSRRRYFGILLLICVVLAVLALLSPGAHQKQGRLHRELFMVLPNWLYFTQKFALKWMLDPFLLAFSAAVVIVTQRYTLRKPFLSLFGAFLLPTGIMYLLAFPGHLTLGALFFPRIMNIIYIFFALAWIVFVLHLSYAIRMAIREEGMGPKLFQQALLIASFVVLLVSFNTHDLRNYNLFITYKGLAKKIPQRYSAELNSRYRMIQNGSDTVRVPQLTTKENNVLYFLDIGKDASHDQNRHYARYWGKKAIAVVKDSSGIAKPY